MAPRSHYSLSPPRSRPIGQYGLAAEATEGERLAQLVEAVVGAALGIEDVQLASND
jgi:hypothetical protein